LFYSLNFRFYYKKFILKERIKMAMKKGRIIASSLAVALMVSGAGYAAWTDQLTINNTVSTGDLNVKFTEAYTRGNDNLNNEYPSYVAHDGGTKSKVAVVETTFNDKSVTAFLGNLYPGAHGSIATRVDNTGSIPAVVKEVKVEFFNENRTALTDAQKELLDTLTFAAGYDIYNGDTPVDGNKDMNWTWGTDLDGVTGTAENSKKGLQYRLNEMLVGKRLEPQQNLRFDIPNEVKAQALGTIGVQPNVNENCIFFTFPLTADDDSSLENQKIGMKITIDWKQHNQ
jgi:predicted ribosomally synthesized peptide with SipW-like signal peptide